MAARRPPDPAAVSAAMSALTGWLTDEDAHPAPDRAQLAEAVRLTARTLAAVAPGAAVEVRVPPFVAVQCIAGPRHTRGTPPNVVETDARTWLRLVAGLVQLDETRADGTLQLSGSRAAEVADWLPLV